MSICLAAGALVVALAGPSVTLAWTHSIEKVEWRETWRAEAGWLVLDEAAVKGSGAGMEPGEGAVLVDGFWTWAPGRRQKEVLLARSEATADWRVCEPGAFCRPLAAIIGPALGEPVRMTSCDQPK